MTSGAIQVDLNGADQPADKYEAIRDLFAALGGVPQSVLAREAINAGIFTDDELETIQVSGVMSICRKALTVKDANGLPYAGPTVEKVDGAPVWRNRELWEFEDYKVNIEKHVRDGVQNLRVANYLADECRLRYGDAPTVPHLD